MEKGASRERESLLCPPTRGPLVQLQEQRGGDSRLAFSDVSAGSKDLLVQQTAILQEENAFLRRYVAKCEAQVRLYQLAVPEAALVSNSFNTSVQGCNAEYIYPLFLYVTTWCTLLPYASGKYLHTLD